MLLTLGCVTMSTALELVRGDGSSHVIYHAADAPESVAMAATELQNYLHKVTGVKVPIVNKPSKPMICLGNNAAAQAAGLSVSDIPPEGFRILTHEGSVYILGPDTSEDELTPQGGKSTGTRNGVYRFLEEFIGVRWLMPGEYGDYVPRMESVAVPHIDMTDAPFFLNRRVPYTQQNRPEVKRWWARQKLGWSLYLNHSHNWRRPIPPELFDEHPDWFAERGGERVPPTGRYKLCTTNEGLVQAFADAAIRFFDERPETSCFSLSPSDSAGWCECEKCTALYEKDPNGRLSVTPAILTFYNNVAKLVAEKYPDKILAGYVYAQYVFPPKKSIKLEPNVFLVWAPSFDYGFTLFKPELQQQWGKLAAQWTQVTENISYYDLPNCVHNEVGAPNPPGLKILQFLYPRLKQHKMKGVYVYGNAAWGHSALMNYLLTKLAWDPDANVEALSHEFCEKAYGAGSEEIKRFYRLLDAETERYFLEDPNERYVLTKGRLQDVYAKNFSQLERLYRSAEDKIEKPDARARLEMLGDNLKILHWNMRQLGLLDDPKASTFYLSDADLFDFLSTRRTSLAIQPIFASRKPAITELAVSPAHEVPNADEVKSFLLRSDQHILIRPNGAEPVEVRFSALTSRGKLVTYSIYRANGEEVKAGVINVETPVILDADASEYYHMFISGGQASYHLELKGAAWAVDGKLSDKGLHLLGKVTPIYFDVPEGVSSFRLQLGATPPGETAIADLYAPDGRKAARFDCTASPVDRQKIAVSSGDAGFWKLVIEKAEVGVIDDVWVTSGDGLSGYFSLVPEQALRVTLSVSE